MAPPVQKQPENSKPNEPVNAELEQLRKENEKLKVELAAKAAPATVVPGAPLPEQYRGTKQYRVGAAGAYRDGRHYSEGEIITVVDDVPSRTWTPYVKPERASAPVVEQSPAPSQRDADTAI